MLEELGNLHINIKINNFLDEIARDAEKDFANKRVSSAQAFFDEEDDEDDEMEVDSLVSTQQIEDVEEHQHISHFLREVQEKHPKITKEDAIVKAKVLSNKAGKKSKAEFNKVS